MTVEEKSTILETGCPHPIPQFLHSSNYLYCLPISECPIRPTLQIGQKLSRNLVIQMECLFRSSQMAIKL
ncbi:unnamed protein product [Hymenolepis diminuta]|uniref:Uncharacterized protein n=1 Tax=Hymenolepis diminuta TaxID=6216 RepID=A0A564ZE80_HYMDI|nr:unnamed protein product [Hymenolepis diminuta]